MKMVLSLSKLILALLEGIRDFADFNLKAPRLVQGGFLHCHSASTFDADMKNTKINVLQFFGSSIFLPDTTTYKTDAAQKIARRFEEAIN